MKREREFDKHSNWEGFNSLRRMVEAQVYAYGSASAPSARFENSQRAQSQRWREVL
jgi:hypothetical protein